MNPTPHSIGTSSPYPASSLLQAPTLWGLVLRRAELTPDAPMLIDAGTDQRMSFAQVAAAAERLAAGFVAKGIRPGTVVTWQIPTSFAAVLTALALARLGAVQNPIISLYRETEVRAVLERSQSAFYVVPGADATRDFPAMARSVRGSLATPPEVIVLGEELPQGDPSILPSPPRDGRAPNWGYYTSGTTSEPIIRGRSIATIP